MKRLFYLCIILLFSSGVIAQTRTITGVVKNAQGDPIPDATILVKGTSTGTNTKADGTFSLSVSENARTLVVSSVGLTTSEVPIGKTNYFTISMSTEAKDLLEVVVQVPYGTVKKTAFTGSESTVSSKMIEKQQVTSVTNTLEGLVPGLIATNAGGAPGSSAGIRIRGIGSINANSSPLYVLDGVPYDGPINALSTNDIESVTVLKDAAAASLYGSRAANGVIMITTKQGKRGRANVNASIRQGYMSRGIPEYDRIGAKDYYELNWESIRNSFVAGGDSYANAGIKASQQLTDGSHLVYNSYNVPGATLVDPATGKLNPSAIPIWNESWEDVLFRSAARTNANLSVSGAGDKSDYYISLGYLNEDGTLKFTGYKRYNFLVKVNTQATSWLNTGLKIDGAMAENNTVTNGGTATTNPFYYTRQMGPIYPVYQHTPTGAFVIDSITGGNALDWGVPAQMGTRPYAGNSNLLGSLDLDDRINKTLSANANTFAEIKFLRDFSFRTSFGINVWDDNTTTYQNSQFGDAQNVQGRGTKTFDRQVSYTLNEVLKWSKLFGKHSVTALAGHENYKYQYNFLTLTRTGFPFPGQTELDNATITESVGGSAEDNHRIESYFGNINYNFDGKYLLSGSYRTDGSSRFAKDYRWGNFYSAGIGWRISQEDFMKNVSWINELKFKASYGEQGNDNIGLYYQYKNYYNADGTGGYSPPLRPANVELKWESNKTFNTGFDFAFFQNKLQGSIEYFTRTSDDLLFDVGTPTSTGNVSVYQNIGTMKNYGFELSLGYNVIKKRDFDWRVDLNLTTFKNEITKLPPNQREKGIISGTKRLMEGGSIYDYYLREFAGVDASNGDALYYRDVLDASGKPTSRVITNSITSATYYQTKYTALPDFSGGLTNSFRYGNFDLSVLLTFSYGGHFYDGNYAGIMHSGSYGIAWQSDILNRWKTPGDVTNVPRLQNSSISTQDGQSTRFLFDGSYLNIKNITLSYNFAKTTSSRLGINGVQIFANVDNAFLFSAKKGMDPQRSFDGTSNATYPPFRTMTFGLNFSL